MINLTKRTESHITYRTWRRRYTSILKGLEDFTRYRYSLLRYSFSNTYLSHIRLYLAEGLRV
jgi:hypothetical protein